MSFTFNKTTGRDKGMNKRENIGMRSDLKFTSKTNFQSVDKQFEKEQRILEFKRQKYQKLNNSRRIALCGHKQEKVEAQREIKKTLDEQMTIKKIREIDSKKVDKHLVNRNISLEKDIFDREAKKKEEKREYLKEMMEENKKLVKLRELKKIEDKKQDVEISKQPDFFEKYRSYL